MNIFGNITSILNPVDTFLWKNEKQAITKQYIAPEVQQKPTMTLFSDEQKMFQKMKEDNLSDDQSFAMLKKRRADILWGNDITQDEKSILLRMQSDNVPVKQAVDMIQKRRKDQFQKKYDEANLLQKWAYNALSFAAGNLETVAKYGGNTLDFITGGQMGFWDQVKKMEQVTQSPEFDSTAFKVGTYLPDVAMAVSPIWGGYLAGSKWMTGLQWAKILSKEWAKNITQWLIWRSAVVGAWFGASQPILEKWSDATMGDIASWAWQWALVWAVASPVISKTLKYGKAGYYGWLEGAGKSISRDIKGGVQAITPSGANISTRANRFNANEIRDFKKMTGESPWEFATSRGMTKTGDDAVVEATNRWQASKDQADDALKAIQWRFKFTWEKDFLKTTLDDLDTRLTNTESPDLWRLKKLKSKYEDSGLTMSEINEIKRLYSNNYKYSFVDAGSESALRSRNLQDAVRKWQFKVAEENWLTNLKEINKTTQGWKTFADSLSKKIQGSSGNNAVSLTDWIALSGWSPENIALYLGKKLASSDTIKRWAIKLFSKQTKPSIIQASKADIQQSNFQKNVNRGVSGVGDNSGGKSLVRPVGLLQSPSGKATWAKNVRVNQPIEKSPIKNEWQVWKRPWTKPIVKPNTIKNESKVSEPVVVPKKIVNTPIEQKKSNIRSTEWSNDFVSYFQKDLWDNITKEWLLKFGFTEKQILDNTFDFLKSKDNKLWVSLEDLFAIAKKQKKPLTTPSNAKQQVSKPVSSDTIPEGTPKVIWLTENWWVKNVEPGKQVKYNQWDYYEPVRMALTQKDADIARFWALSKKQMKTSISENEKLEMAWIKGRLKMSNAELETRAQELREIAKLARSDKESVLVDLRNWELPEGYFKNVFWEIQKNPSNKKGGFIRIWSENPFAKNPYISWDFSPIKDLDSDALYRAIGTKDWDNIPKKVTLYRGIKSDKDFELFSWDFLTKNRKIAENFAWKNWRVKAFKVDTDDLYWSDFWYEEVIYKPSKNK